MDYQQTAAILLRRQPVTESSLIVTWFTRGRGKLRTMAKGARRTKGPFVGKLDLFYEDEIVVLLSRRSDLHLLHDAFILHAHRRLRDSVAGMTAAAYACEMVELGTEIEDAHPRVYDLLTAVLGAMEEKPSATLLLWFELQLLTALGWKPHWPREDAPVRFLTSLATTTLAGVQRIRLTSTQVREAQETLWRFGDEQFNRAPRSRKLLLETVA